VPTIQQLVRKGRQDKVAKNKTAGAQGEPAAPRRVHARYTTTRRSELALRKVPRRLTSRSKSRVHPWRRAQLQEHRCARAAAGA